MGAGLVGQSLAEASFPIGLVRGPQNRDKDLRVGAALDQIGWPPSVGITGRIFSIPHGLLQDGTAEPRLQSIIRPQPLAAGLP